MNRNCMNQNMNQNCMNQTISKSMGQGMMYQRNGSGSRISSGNRAQNGGCVQNDSRIPNDSRNTPSMTMEIPNSCRAELICFINEVSFAAYDAMLYLDTHPDCHEALQNFRKYNELRNKALKIHAKSYGPLMLSSVDETECSSWEWMMQPWPWELEGGAC